MTTLGLGLWVYQSTDAIPRWRSDLWQVPSGGSGVAVHFDLADELVAPRRLAWLIDLETWDEPSVQVRLNGRQLAPDEYAWFPLICTDRHPRGSPSLYRALGGQADFRLTNCVVYATLAAHGKRRVSSLRQWWVLLVDPSSFPRLRSAHLELLPKQGGKPLAIGVVVGAQEGTTGYGPRPLIARGTSVYRWETLDDWRLWGQIDLEPARRESSLTGLRPHPSDAREDRLQKLLSRGAGRFVARLIVVTRDQQLKIY